MRRGRSDLSVAIFAVQRPRSPLVPVEGLLRGSHGDVMPDDWLYSSSTSSSSRRRRAAVRRRRNQRAAAVAVLAAVAALAALAVTTSGSQRSGAHPHVRAHLPSRFVSLRRHASPPDPANAAIDRILRQTRYVSSGGRRREVALTFDDGPGPYTPEVLAILERGHVPATFFQVGRMIPVFHLAARDERSRHFPIGDHTQNHPLLAALAADRQRAEIVDQTAAMRRNGEPAPRLFRPPYRSYDRTTLGILHSLHMLMVLWSVDSQDYRLPGVPAIVERVLSGARPGAIVLLHDGGGPRSQTVAALPLIIAGLRARHYKLVTVPQLLETDPPLPQQQVAAPRPGGGG